MAAFEFIPGAVYLVLKSFEDFDGDTVKQGTKLTFVDRNYFPYDGGLTLVFREGVIRLREGDQDHVLSNMAEHFSLLPQDTWSA